MLYFILNPYRMVFVGSTNKEIFHNMETPSIQQQAVIDQFVKNGTGSLNLVARAGTGKTTTLRMIAKHTKELDYPFGLQQEHRRRNQGEIDPGRNPLPGPRPRRFTPLATPLGAKLPLSSS